MCTQREYTCTLPLPFPDIKIKQPLPPSSNPPAHIKVGRAHHVQVATNRQPLVQNQRHSHVDFGGGAPREGQLEPGCRPIVVGAGRGGAGPGGAGRGWACGW